MYDTRNLGNHYFLWEGDHYKYDIVWSHNENNGSAGGTIITENVVMYSFNESYVIAKTKEYKTSTDSAIKFWLIDKRMPVDFNKENWKKTIVTGPLDSIGLIRHMRLNKIELTLKDVPSH